MTSNSIAKLSCFTLLLAALLLFSTAATVLGAPSKTVFILFDVSESTRTASVREQYLKDMDKILKGIQSGDAIAADRIAESSAAGSTLPINLEMESAFNSNPLKEKKAKKKIHEEVEILLNKPDKVNRTDILSSLHIAERIFSTYNRKSNVLVIMSDMVEDSKSYNFEKEKLTDKRIGEIIAKEKKAGRLPDLKNVQVYAVKNATVQSRVAHTDIQNFWLRFLQEAGAKIDKAHYGPLTRFE